MKLDFEDTFVKLPRSFIDWQWFHSKNELVLFLTLLINCNWEDKSWQGIIVHRGQIVTSVRHLARDSKLSHQEVRTALKHLESTRDITRESTHDYTIITIENYEEIQGDYKYLTHESTHKLTNEQQTTNKRPTTTKEDKNIRIKEECCYTDIQKALSPDEIDLLYEKYDNAGDLVQFVFEDVKKHNRLIKKPYEYVLSVAKNIHWGEPDFDIGRYIDEPNF